MCGLTFGNEPTFSKLTLQAASSVDLFNVLAVLCCKEVSSHEAGDVYTCEAWPAKAESSPWLFT